MINFNSTQFSLVLQMLAVAIFTVLFLSFNFRGVFHTVLFCQIYHCGQTALLTELNCHLLILFHHTRAQQARRCFPFLFMEMTTILLSGTWPEIVMIFIVASYYLLFSCEKIYLLVSKKMAVQVMSWSFKNRQVWLFQMLLHVHYVLVFSESRSWCQPQDAYI